MSKPTLEEFCGFVKGSAVRHGKAEEFPLVEPTTVIADLGYDSLDFVELVMDVEELYNIELSHEFDDPDSKITVQMLYDAFPG